MYCKLIDAITTPLTLNLAHTKEYAGRQIATYKPIKFVPGEKYEVPDDELFIRSLKACTKKDPYSAELEEILTKYGVPYEIVMCKSCGGRKKKIEYNVVEVIE